MGGPSAADIVSPIVDPETNHDPGCDGELLQRYQAASHFRRRNFGVVIGHVDRHGADGQTGDEAASEDARSAADDPATLHNDPHHEHTHVGDDGILSGERLGQEAGIEASDPRSELKDGGHPSLLCGVLHPDPHMIAEGGHGEDSGEDALVVSIDETSEASKACNPKDPDILDQRCRA